MIDRAIFDHGFHLLHSIDTQFDGSKVGQRTAEPPSIDIVCSATLCFFGDGCLNLLLGTDENDFSTIGYVISHRVIGLSKQIDRLLQVDDVNPFALCEDVARHLGVPLSCSMPEMYSRFEQLFHRKDVHITLPNCPELMMPEYSESPVFPQSRAFWSTGSMIISVALVRHLGDER